MYLSMTFFLYCTCCICICIISLCLMSFIFCLLCFSVLCIFVYFRVLPTVWVALRSFCCSVPCTLGRRGISQAYSLFGAEALLDQAIAHLLVLGKSVSVGVARSSACCEVSVGARCREVMWVATVVVSSSLRKPGASGSSSLWASHPCTATNASPQAGPANLELAIKSPRPI